MIATYSHDITIKADKKTIKSIREFVRSDYHTFDFQKIVPIVPGQVFELGRKTGVYPSTFGFDAETLWGDTCNFCDEYFEGDTFYCLGDLEICSPVMKELSRLFPEATIIYNACVDNYDYTASKSIYEVFKAGELIESEYEETPYDEDDEDDEDDYDDEDDE